MDKRKTRKVICILATVLLFSQLIGCFSYREINKITFVTSMIFDIDDNGDSKLYLDCVIPHRNESESSDKGVRVLFEGTGKTALDAMKNMNINSGNNLNFTQIRAYIFTEKASKEGINKFIDLIDKNQQLGYKSYMFIYYGEIKELLEKASKDEEYLGLHLDNLIETNKKNQKIVSSNVSDYVTKNLQKNQISLLTNLKIEKNLLDNKIIVNGSTIMKNGVVLKKLNEEETSYYNLLTRNVRDGSVIIENPENQKYNITLEILENILSIDSNIVDNKVIINRNLNINSNIGEIQGEYTLDKNGTEKIINSSEKELTKRLKTFIDYMYNEEIDILDLDRYMEITYRKYDESILQNKTINVNVSMSIDGSGLTKDSLF